MGTCIVPALVVALALVGCGKSSPRMQTQSETSTLTAVCEEASRELFTIDRQKLSTPEASVFGKLIEEGAREGERVDKATGAKVQRVPTSSTTATVLANLAHSRGQLQAVIGAVQRHGVAYSDLPRGLLLSFLRANSGCGLRSTRRGVLVIR
jgi:hypothetical protein